MFRVGGEKLGGVGLPEPNNYFLCLTKIFFFFTFMLKNTLFANYGNCNFKVYGPRPDTFIQL